jgi:hypothetical protein
MPYKDPVKARQYQRDYQRRKRRGLTKSEKTNLVREIQDKTIVELWQLHRDIAKDLEKNGLDAKVVSKNRALLDCIRVGIKLYETFELVDRIVVLEGEQSRRPIWINGINNFPSPEIRRQLGEDDNKLEHYHDAGFT